MYFQSIVLLEYLEYNPEQPAFNKNFESQAKIVERSEFENKSDFFDKCKVIVEFFQDEIEDQFEKILTESDCLLKVYKSVNRRRCTVDSKGGSIEEYIQWIMKGKKFIDENWYKNSSNDYWCVTTNDGIITRDIFKIKHKQYYLILNIIIPSLQENQNKVNSSSDISCLTKRSERRKKNKVVVLPFEKYLYHVNKPALMNKLHQLLDNSKGKEVAVVIQALKDCGFLYGYNSRNSLYKSMEKEFGYIGNYSGLNFFFNTNNPKLDSQQVECVKNILLSV